MEDDDVDDNDGQDDDEDDEDDGDREREREREAMKARGTLDPLGRNQPPRSSGVLSLWCSMKRARVCVSAWFHGFTVPPTPPRHTLFSFLFPR